jgi:hypothetical protein
VTPAEEGSDDVRTDEQEDLEVLDEVEWLTDADGTEYFVHDGVRYELGDDGYAYEVGPVGEVPTELPAAAAGHRPARPPEREDDPAAARPRPTRPGSSRRSRPRSRRSHGVREPVPETTGRAPARPREGTLLRCPGLRSGYGSLPVLHGVDIEVSVGETAVLFGLNGAGKTTTAMNVCGALKPWDGTITFDGQDVTTWNTKRCVDAGIVMVPEGRRVFPDLSVGRNLQVGAWTQRKDEDWVASSSSRCSTTSRACASGRTSSPAPSPAVSSRCWRWRAG